MTRLTGSVALTSSLPVEVLMKSAPAIIATMQARATLRSVFRSPVARIAFRCAAPQASRKARDLVVERLPVAGQHMRAGDDDVDLARRRRRPRADLGDALRQRRQAGREAGGDRRRPGCRVPSSAFTAGADHGRVDADRADRRRRVGQAERVDAGRGGAAGAPWRRGGARGPACRRRRAWSGRCR